MLCKLSGTTASLLVPLLLVSSAVQAGVPRGWVVGPAPSQSLVPSGNSNRAPGSPAPLRQVSAFGACDVYFDATGQLSFLPPAANTPLSPGITSSELVGSSPAFGHGTAAVSAVASQVALTSNARIDGVGLQPPNGSVTQQKVQGVAYFATSLGCSTSSFSASLQSAPSSGSAGTVLATSTADPTMLLTASYSPSFSTDGVTYICVFGNGNGNGNGKGKGHGNETLCSVWSVDVVFSFLTANLPANGADDYTLSINQVTLSSP